MRNKKQYRRDKGLKKRILCWVLAVMLAVPVSALAADEEQTELPGDQRKATIMVLSITGNEMTYVEIDTDQEDESEPDSEEMRELESEEMPEPESDAEGAPEGGQMPQMCNMEDMIEAFQENGGDMSQMEDMMEAFQENGGPGGGGQMPEGGGQPADDDGQMPEDGDQPAEDGQSADGEENGGPGGGGGMPQMGNMEDMIEAFQENGGDMSQMQDMMEAFQGNGGPMQGGDDQTSDDGGQSSEGDNQEPETNGQQADGEGNGGPGGGGGMPQMGNMEDMIEAFQENGGDTSQIEDMIEAFQENGGGQMPGGAQNGEQAENGEEFSGPMSGATTVYLQVGVVVHADGKDKTFSILEAGDELEALFETDDEGNEVITEMWLLDN